MGVCPVPHLRKIIALSFSRNFRLLLIFMNNIPDDIPTLWDDFQAVDVCQTACVFGIWESCEGSSSILCVGMRSFKSRSKSQVLKLESACLPDTPQDGHVHVKWLGSPINPADLNMIEGVYPIKPTLPAVGGNEGYGRVVKVGIGVKNLCVGDHVIPAKSGQGTWRSDSHHKEDDLFRIDNTLSTEASCCLQVNPPTAYRMLKDFVDLKNGDIVIQNGANSAVGKAVIQICRLRGYCSVNIVRIRDDMAGLINELKNLGADYVITEDQLVKEYRGKFKGVKLALNCVGGKSALILASNLGFRGCMVTYGGMSKMPLQVPTGPLIFKDIRLAGFWMSRWYEDPNNFEERKSMYAELCGWLKSGDLKPPEFEKRGLDEYAAALEAAAVKFNRKQLFIP
ncbi:GroES-like protein [Dictyocaulus viviparus]|uniref:Enoyl-[acyl-carrier-protein] reductase, mitochondrial n=1 Tax=Dictyocaulus viviparus TaxID=29172 RepID=A0A0D8XDK8_DICVI|nr:GroES-like protein [Dictyocaulus viviparus]